MIGIKTFQSRFFVAAQQKTNNRRYLPARAVRAAAVLARPRSWHNPASGCLCSLISARATAVNRPAAGRWTGL
jgi:hypothetical protein